MEIKLILLIFVSVIALTEFFVLLIYLTKKGSIFKIYSFRSEEAFIELNCIEFKVLDEKGRKYLVNVYKDGQFDISAMGFNVEEEARNLVLTKIGDKLGFKLEGEQ